MKRGIFFSSLFLLLACGEVVAPTESDAGLVSTIDGGSFVNSDASTPVGGLNQMCYPNGTCNADFSCVDNLCEEEVACPAPTIIYLNKLGGVFGNGSPESAVYNTSLMFNVVPQNLAEWAPSTSAVWDDIVATFENVLSEFNIDVVTNDPGNIDHYEIVMTTDSPAEFFELPASFDPKTLAVMVSPGCLQSQRVAFVFPKSIGVSEVTLPHYLLKATGLMIGASFSKSETSFMSTTVASTGFPNEMTTCLDEQCRCTGDNEQIVSEENIYQIFENGFGARCAN